ncbi:hypothetical protein V8F06_007208 [Rhypophila decipiens]
MVQGSALVAALPMLRAARSYRLLCQETDPLAVKAAVDSFIASAIRVRHALPIPGSTGLAVRSKAPKHPLPSTDARVDTQEPPRQRAPLSHHTDPVTVAEVVDDLAAVPLSFTNLVPRRAGAVDDHAGGDPVLPIPLESRYKWSPRPGDPQDAVYMSTRYRSHPRSSLYDDTPSAEARNRAILFHLLQLYCETSPSHTYDDHTALFADHVERGLIEQLGEDGRIWDRTRFTLAGLLACFPRLRYVSRAHRTAFLLRYRALHSSLPR